MSEVNRGSKWIDKRRVKLNELFPCDIGVGDRVIISAGPNQKIVGHIVKEKREVRYDLRSSSLREQPVFQVELIEPEGKVLEHWHTRYEVSYSPTHEEIWSKAKAIREFNEEERNKRYERS